MYKSIVLAGVLFSTLAFSQQIATGYVFEDSNHNKKKESKEKGLAQVAVSNGEDIVLTDQNGKYSLPVKDGQSIFVIKPSGYKTAFSENNLPEFYYHYRPEGSPENFKYKGIAPTGKLPKEINFGLTPQSENKDFSILVFGDPQPYNEKELDYFRRGIVEEVKKNKKNAVLGISLGDIVGDDLNLQPKYSKIMKEIGLPWYNVMGNHDMNLDAKEDHLSDETFEANFGPANYSFNYGNVHFIVLDDILYPDPRGGKSYWGGFREDQLKFVENDLKLVDKNKLIVISYHIPLFLGGENHFRKEDRERLFQALKPFENALLLSAHTHVQQQLFYGKKAGWDGLKPLHEYNVGTTSGDWYSGTPDATGVPASTMRDGTYRGYSFIHFKDNQYSVDYKVAGKSEDFQIQIHVPKVIPFQSKNSARIFANFFMGSKGDKVEYRIDNGEWKDMKFTETIDPNFAISVFQWDTTNQLMEGRRPSNPDISQHLWMTTFPKKLSLGKHQVEVRATDRYGKTFTSSAEFKVENAISIP